MKTWVVASIVVHQSIDADCHGVVDLLLPGGYTYSMRIDEPLVPGALIQLLVADMPQNQRELLTHMVDRLPNIQRGHWRTTPTVEHHGVVMVLDDEYIVIQRRGKATTGLDLRLFASRESDRIGQILW